MDQQPQSDRGNPGQRNGTSDAESKEKSDDQKFSEYKDHGWAWFVVTASFFSNFLTDGIVSCTGVFFVVFLQEFNGSKSHTAVIGSLLVAVMNIVGLFAGTACDKFGFRAVAIFGTVVAAVGYAISGLATNIVHLYFSMGILGGIGIGMVYFTSIACVQHYFDKRCSLAMGIAVSGTGVGTFVLPPFVEWLLAQIGWRMTSLVIGCLFLLGIPLACVYRPTPGPEQNNQIVRNPINDDVSPKTKVHFALCQFVYAAAHFFKNTFNFTLLRDPCLTLFIVSAFFQELGFFVPFLFVPDHAKSQGISVKDATLLISILGITNTVNRIVVGLVADFKCINRLALFTCSIFLSGLATLSTPFCDTYPQLAVDMGALGFFSGCYVSLAPVVLRDIVGLDTFNRSFGVYLLVLGIGSAMNSLAGAMHDLTGDYLMTFLYAGSSLCVATIPMAIIPVIRRFMAKRKPTRDETNKCHLNGVHIPNESETTRL